uniref:Uncharacterized protein n=1 Tax=Setaria italica TaxID=4555 RepID=K3YX86_SETIT
MDLPTSRFRCSYGHEVAAVQAPCLGRRAAQRGRGVVQSFSQQRDTASPIIFVIFSLDSCEPTFLISQPQKISEIWFTVRHHPLHP